MLFWIIIIKVALKALWGAKLRSFLATLGVIIGVGAVIAMLAIVEGARREMEKWIVGMGTNVMFVWPNYRSVAGKGANPQLKLEDARRVLVEAAAVRRVSPVVETSESLKFYAKNTRAQVSGVAPSFLQIRNMTVEHGRGFTDGEVAGSARVAVLGPKTAGKLFGGQDPVGQILKIDRHSFEVIGVLKSKGGGMFGNEDDRVIVPYTTLRQELVGRDATLGNIIVQAWTSEDLRKAERQVKTILRRQHHIKEGEKDDFAIFNQAELREGQEKAVGIFRIVLGGVGGICLLTGGIGIMNIMLVTVTERTREIGLRKAIGAKKRDILAQFLLESVLMSGLGGIIGVGVGWCFAALVSGVTPIKTVISPESVALAMLFAGAVGVFFGYYPALRAARLDPIEALRFE